MVSEWVAALSALAGKQVLLQALAIVGGTFVLEDAATVLAAMRAQEGGVSILVALLSLYAGIVLGDLGLYGLGRLARSMPIIARHLPPDRTRRASEWICARVFRVVIVSRFMPGMRLPTYTTCGYLGANFQRFALAAIVATIVWTSLLFSISLHVGQFLIDHLGVWRWAGAVGFAVVVLLVLRGAARLQEHPQGNPS